MNELGEKIYEKQGFIYRIGTKYYALGANIFAEVTNQAQIDNLELLQNAMRKNNERQISKYLDKIVRIAATYRVAAREHMKQRDRLYAFLEELERDEPQQYRRLEQDFADFGEYFERYSRFGSENQLDK